MRAMTRTWPDSNNDLEVLAAPAPATRTSSRLKFAKSSRIREIDTAQCHERSLFSITYEWLFHCYLNNKAMLKIERSLEDGVVFTMSGRIEAEDVAEVQRLFSLEGVNQPITLDLREVTLVDRDAVKFLASCEADAIKLKNCPAYVRKWIDAERNGR
jgi:hypothetical protein